MVPPQKPAEAVEGRTAFFYGTLMAPQVLHRVCHGNTSPTNPIYTTHNLRSTPAILPAHRRHRVRDADYPAIVATPSDPGASVRGTCVTGLTDADVWRLDIFEGGEYERRGVRVKLVKGGGGGEEEQDEGVEEGEEEEEEEMEAETYVWIAGRERLEEGEWDFAAFRREKMRFWVGPEGGEEGVEGREDIMEVDEAVAAKERAEGKRDGTGGRGLNGHISSALAAEHDKDDELKNAV